MLNDLNICIVGATGLVGQEMLNEIEDFSSKVTRSINIDLYASSKSKGKKVQGKLKEYEIFELTKDIDFEKYNIALFSAGKNISLEYGPLFAKYNCYVIDNSSAFREDEDKALLTMGVNFSDFKNYDSKIIANPNCSTIQSVIAINNLNNMYNIVDIDYVTYQSVSGSGEGGIRDLELTLKGEVPQNYDYPIANNVIPQIDKMLNTGYTFEEMKMVNETKKILNIDANISATCVRIPVSSGHTVQIRVEVEENIDLDKIYDLLAGQKYLKVLKDDLPMPLYMKGQNHVEVGRIRRHNSKNNVLFLMTVADNLKVGAATNACEIAKYLIEEEIC